MKSCAAAPFVCSNDAQREKENQQREIAGKMGSSNIMCGVDTVGRGVVGSPSFSGLLDERILSVVKALTKSFA